MKTEQRVSATENHIDNEVDNSMEQKIEQQTGNPIENIIENKLSSQLETRNSSADIMVRAYQATDYSKVLALWEQAKLRPFTEAEVLRLLASGGAALVAVRNKNEIKSANNDYQEYDNEDKDHNEENVATKVIGVVLWSHNGSIGILWRLAVAEEARGMGIATLLLDRAEQDIMAAGLSGVSLLTRVDNTVAKGMYARRGYRWNDHLEFWGKKLHAKD